MSSPAGKVVQHLRLMLDGSAARDGELLERFAAVRDQDAFAALLQRHGPLVFGVCRRILHSVHDAEDAFQATFLVLARRAAAIRRPESLASWLYEVAYRLARKMKADLSKRRLRDEKATPREPAGPPDLSWREVQSVLDEELRGLPDKHRQPLLLCYLEGLTQEEAADQLGWPRGTLKRRLERGRELLRSRLTRRGLSMGAALGLALPAGEALALPVPSVLRSTTLRAATLYGLNQTQAAGVASTRGVGLAENLMRTMFRAKLKLAVFGVLLGAVLALGSLVVVQQVTIERTSVEDSMVVDSVQNFTAPVPVMAPEPLKLAIELPPGQTTVRDVNDGNYNIVVKLENASSSTATVWPYLSIELLDAEGNNVAPSKAIGRHGLRSGDKSILEGMEFAKLKPGEAYRFDVNLADYQRDPEMLYGWQLLGQGEYTLQVHYKFDRASVKERFGEGSKVLAQADQPWNRAVAFDKKAEIKIPVAANANELPQARNRDYPIRDHGRVELNALMAASEARNWGYVETAGGSLQIIARGHRA